MHKFAKLKQMKNVFLYLQKILHSLLCFQTVVAKAFVLFIYFNYEAEALIKE